jgi:hypothetical protein
MDTKQLLSQLRAERDRIAQAISAIEALDGADARSSERSTTTRTRKAATTTKTPGRRTMSAAARKRISEAAKKRWAERKKAAKSA